MSKQIEMHFTEIMRLSEQLNALAKKLRTLAGDEVMQIIRENKACWNSEGADILMGKEAKISAGILSEAERLCKAAGEMEGQAKRMYQSELINVQHGLTRTYS